MTDATIRLVEQLDELYGKVGSESITAARILVEDFLGVAVAGSRTPAGQIVHRYAAGAGHSGPCHIAGSPQTFDAALAALVIGTSGYSIGLTDTHARSITHPGPSIVPAALAVAQTTGASGMDMLRAVVLG